MKSLTVIAAVPIVGFLLAGCGGDAESNHAPAAPTAELEARVVRAALSAAPAQIDVAGTAEPWRRVAPGSKLMGRIARVPVREGDAVRRGQLLAELDSRDLQAAVEQARAALAMADANDENARVNHERMRKLHGRGSVTDKNLEDAVAAARTSAAAVEQARAALAAAEVTLDHAVLASPLDGWVTRRYVETGDMATPGAPMFELEDLSRIKAVLNVPEAGVVGIRPGDPVEVSVDVLRLLLPATVDRVMPSGDPASRTYAVHVLLDNPGGQIKSGMFLRAAFGGQPREALLVPRSAVVSRGQLTGVFTVGDDGVVSLRWVRTGRETDGKVEILSGLAAGERFVPQPPPAMVDGVRVREI